MFGPQSNAVARQRIRSSCQNSTFAKLQKPKQQNCRISSPKVYGCRLDKLSNVSTDLQLRWFCGSTSMSFKTSHFSFIFFIFVSPLSWMTIQCQRKCDKNFLSCVAGCRSDRRPSPAKNSLAKTQCCRDVAKLLLVRLVFWWYENVSKLPGPVAMDKSVCSRKSLNVWECCQRSFPSSSSRRNGFLISLVVVKFFFA